MSRIDELLEELAPAGVRHVQLSDVAKYSDTRVDAVELDETSFVGVDNLVAGKGGRVDATYLPNTARLTAYEPGDILLGNIRPYLKKVWLATYSGGCSGDVLAVRLKPATKETLASEFLYYLLSSDGFFAYNMQHAKGAKMPRGNKAAILNYRIPVPPLEVQREIVSIGSVRPAGSGAGSATPPVWTLPRSAVGAFQGKGSPTSPNGRLWNIHSRS